CAFLFFYYFYLRLNLLSFPTRRSSDLLPRRRARPPGAAGLDVAGPVRQLLGLPGGRRLAARRHHHAGRPAAARGLPPRPHRGLEDRKSTRLNSSHSQISYAVFCLKKKI